MRKAIFALSVAVAVSSANASYLYWQIDTSETTKLVDKQYTGAKVFASNNGGVVKNYLDIGYGDFDTGNFIQFADQKVQIPLYDAVVADLSTYANDSSYKFYIELINYNTGEFVAQTDSSSAMTYADLEAKHYVGADLSPVSMAVWHGGSYTTVPEPTSAMLVLFGLAGLALKRRTA